MEIYFDNAATTRPSDEVIDIMTKVMKEDYGNPSSKHLKGVDAEKYIRNARETIAGILKVNEKEILFTSGGTESNNMAITGAAMANKRAGNHIITTAFEHSAVLEPMKYLEKQGFEVTYLDVDREGHIDLEDLDSKITDETILVSVMFVNNETGAVQNIEEIGRVIKNKNPDTIFHTDAIQAFGKYRIYPKKTGIDLMSVSSHKFHGPKGTGFLYINSGIKINPIILGGGQQKNMRSGTEDVPSIAGMAKAAEMAYETLDENFAYISGLKDYTLMNLLSRMSGHDGKPALKVRANSYPAGFSAPHIVSITFENVKSEVLLHALEDKGIYVSAGSACASNRSEISKTLTAVGLTKQQADSTIRLSFCKNNTTEEIDEFFKAIDELVPVLSRFTSK